MILTNTPDRIVYGQGTPGTYHLVPELPLVGWSRFRHACPGHLHLHRHSRAHELHLVVDGQVEWTVNGESHLLTAGDIYVTRPGEPHGGTGGTMQPCTLIWFLLAAPDGCHQTSSPACDGDQRLPRRARATPAMTAAFRRILDEHARPDPKSAASVRAALALLLIDLDRVRLEQAVEEDVAHAAALERATSYLVRDLAGPATVAGACAAAGLNRTTLGRLFADRHGLSIIGWRQRARLRIASRRLHETDDGVTRIAVDLGFASSQHFATAFRKHYGLSPTAFRAQSRSSSRGHEAATPEWSAAVERRQWHFSVA